MLENEDTVDDLNRIAASAFTKLGCTQAAPFVYRWDRFGVLSDTTTFFTRDKLAVYRGIPASMRDAIADHARGFLDAESGSGEHAKAVWVLAHLGDDLLVDHLSDRLSINGVLSGYENHALMALGSDSAAGLFARSIEAVAERLDETVEDGSDDEKNRLWYSIIPLFDDDRYLTTPALESSLRKLIEAGATGAGRIATEIALRLGIATLVFTIFNARPDAWFGMQLFQVRVRSPITPDAWIDWWRSARTIEIKRALLAAAPRHPSADVEEVLVDCLGQSELRGAAASVLAEYGSIRAGRSLRDLLTAQGFDLSPRDQATVIRALGDLGDRESTPCLRALVASDGGTEMVREAAVSLGLIGGCEAETTLLGLLGIDEHKESAIEELIAQGSPSAMEAVLAEARSRPDGISWLSKRVRNAFFSRGHKAGEYFTHLDTSGLVRFLEERYETTPPEEKWDVFHIIERFDSAGIRCFLRNRLALRGSAEDAIVREDDGLRMSWLCSSELANRRDETAIPYILDDPSRQPEGTVADKEHELRRFSARAVASEVSRRLDIGDEATDVPGLLYLLGRFGDQENIGQIDRYQHDDDDSVSAAACEAFLRLTDPALLPDGW